MSSCVKPRPFPRRSDSGLVFMNERQAESHMTITRTCVGFAFAVMVSLTHATIVVFQWTPTEILLAADSLTAKVSPGQINGVFQCKIHQAGDVFFTIVGVNDDDAIKVDLVAVANKAARTRGGILEKMSRFEILAKTQIEAIMRQGLTHRLGFSSEPERIDVIFVDRKSHILVLKEYVETAGGLTSSLPRQVYSAPGKASEPVGVGVFAEAQAAVLKNPALSRLEGVPFVAALIQSQIEYETYRLRTLQTIPRAGGNICILRIEHGTASWVPGYQQPCPAIKPQYRQERNPKPHKRKCLSIW